MNRVRRNNYITSISRIALGFIVLLTFMVQYFNNMLQSISVFLALLTFFTIVVFAFKRRLKIANGITYNWLWIIALAVLLISYIPADPYISVYADLVVFICGILIIAFNGANASVYGLSMKVIKVMSICYAVSIWIQLLLPSIYNAYLAILTAKDRMSIIDFRELDGMYTGFSTNCGFTAAHLSAGILCYISTLKLKRKKSLLILLFLFVSLLMTGKRSTFIFLVLTIVLLYIISAKKREKIKVYLRIYLVLLTIVLLYFMLGGLFSMVPAISRMTQTVDGLLLGMDVSSNRTLYYGYAWELFKDNLWFGVGWGNYRNLTLGHVTWVNTVEVHNIYLQMLTEMGIIGFCGMVIPMVVVWVKTKSFYRELLSVKAVGNVTWRALMFYSLGYQTFFLLQGLTENPLYDINFSLMYLVCCSIPAAYSRFRRYNGNGVGCRSVQRYG